MGGEEAKPAYKFIEYRIVVVRVHMLQTGAEVDGRGRYKKIYIPKTP